MHGSIIAGMEVPIPRSAPFPRMSWELGVAPCLIWQHSAGIAFSALVDHIPNELRASCDLTIYIYIARDMESWNIVVSLGT